VVSSSVWILQAEVDGNISNTSSNCDHVLTLFIPVYYGLKLSGLSSESYVSCK